MVLSTYDYTKMVFFQWLFVLYYYIEMLLGSGWVYTLVVSTGIDYNSVHDAHEANIVV